MSLFSKDTNQTTNILNIEHTITEFREHIITYTHKITFAHSEKFKKQIKIKTKTKTLIFLPKRRSFSPHIKIYIGFL